MALPGKAQVSLTWKRHLQHGAAAEERETQNWSRNNGVVAQKVPAPGTFLSF